MYSRLTYVAFGEFRDDERRGVVHEEFTRFNAALQAGRSAEQAAEVFEPNAREAASRAARAIRAVEVAIGEKRGAFPSYTYLPKRQPWWPNCPERPKYTVSTFCVGISDHFIGSRAAMDAVIEAASALGELLSALGATEVESVWLD